MFEFNGVTIARRSLTWVAMFILLGLQACGTIDVAQRYHTLANAQALPADYFDVDIPTHDGLTLRATVYQPALAPGEAAPLIIHTHGFGAFRAPRPLSLYGQLVISGEAAIAAWRQGYWVISYDQRGFGASEGDVQLMHPDFEVRDLSSVIDWAEARLPRLQQDIDGGTAIGTVGESYGGGVQILASFQDPRIDALVPITTWYDLANVIAPGQQVKSAWGSALVMMGGLGSGFDFGLALEPDYLKLFGGRLNERVQADLAVRSPSTYCDQGLAIQGDALFVQGFRDTLMPVNEAFGNWQCARAGGRDARLVAIQDGHILLWPMQSWSGLPLFNTQAELTCGDKRFTTVEMIVGWWNEKLRQQPPARAQRVPDLCVAYTDDDGAEIEEFVVGGPAFSVREANVSLAQSGLLEVVLAPADWLWGTLTGWLAQPLPADQQAVSGGWLRPAFVPLLQLEQSADLAGIPVLDVDLSTTRTQRDGAVFVAVGVRKPGSAYIDVLSEQYTPLAGDGHYQVQMPAVARRLLPGETIGLVVQGFTAQYFLNAQGWLSSARLSGQVQLPLLPAQPLLAGPAPD